MRRFWKETLRQGERGGTTAGEQLAAVPFVDYARGDGLAIGPGQVAEWSPILIDDRTPWVSSFDGLFGLDTKDRFAGERAPAGPKFNRDGRPRGSWVDPVGFAGLEATPPPSRQVGVLERQSIDLAQQLQANDERVTAAESKALDYGARLLASRQAGRSDAVLAPIAAERDAAVAELTALRRSGEAIRTLLDDTQAQLARARAGDPGDPRAHLRFVAHPQDPSLIRRSRILDVWAALSVAAAILIIGSLLFLGIEQWWIGLPAVIAGYIAIEALVRRRFLGLLLNVTAVLAVIGALILIRTYLVETVALAVLGVGILILRDNARELRASLRS
jgi:hypothetical protein